MNIRVDGLCACAAIFLSTLFAFTARAGTQGTLDPHFTFLYQLLKDNYDGYSYYIFSTTTEILIMVGWLLTSKDARAYIARHSLIKGPLLAGVIFFIVAEINFSLGAMHTSDETIGLLQKAATASADPIISEAYYLPKRVPLSAIVVFVAAHIVLYAILVAIIWSISESTDVANSGS